MCHETNETAIYNCHLLAAARLHHLLCHFLKTSDYQGPTGKILHFRTVRGFNIRKMGNWPQNGHGTRVDQCPSLLSTNPSIKI
jgi:hypothetical protein